MRRVSLLAVSVVFILALLGLVITDISEYGVHLVDVVAVPILVFFTIVLIGSLRRGAPPP